MVKFDDMPKTDEHTKRWNQIARETLKGRVIADAFYMSHDDCESMGWQGRALIVQFTDGSQLMAQCDDEGNDAGALLWADDKTSTLLPVL